MTNRKSTKRALLLSALSLLLCMAMLVGSTFAWFTDSVTSGRNTIVSGQLDVNLYYATLDANNEWTDYAPVTESTKMFNENALYEPGYTEVVKFKVVNEGTLALKYSLDAKIYGETAGKNVYGETFNLSEYLYTGTLAAGDYTREAAVAAATTQLASGFNMKATTILQPEAVEELVLVLTMPTTVGNEANHVDGFQPKIDLGITLIATQATYEADDFDNLYDTGAALPLNLSASAPVDANGTNLAISAPGTKLPAITASVPTAAVEAGATDLTLNVLEQANVLDGITVSADQVATTYDIEVTGIADSNTTPIAVTMQIGAGLTNVKLYHNTTEIACTYDATTGILSFTTTSFSPYTVVADAEETFEVATVAELAAAVNNVKAGGKVVLTADIEIKDAAIVIGKNMTLDLNGKTLACNVSKGRALQVKSGVDFVLDAEDANVTFGNGTYGIIDMADQSVNTTVTVNGGTFEGTSDGGAFVKLRNGTNIVVNLNNVNYTENAEVKKTGMINAFVMDTNGKAGSWTVNMNGGVYNVACGINVATSTKLTMTGVTMNARGHGIEAGNATISNCNIALDPGSHVYSIEGACVTVNNGGLITVTDSTLTSSTYVANIASSQNDAGEYGKIVLNNCDITAPAINCYSEYGEPTLSGCTVK